jgi:hypothetical protein
MAKQLATHYANPMRITIIILGSILPVCLCLLFAWGIIGPHRSSKTYGVSIYNTRYSQPLWSASIIGIFFLVSIWKFSIDDFIKGGNIGSVILIISTLCSIGVALFSIAKIFRNKQ